MRVKVTEVWGSQKVLVENNDVLLVGFVKKLRESLAWIA